MEKVPEFVKLGDLPPGAQIVVVGGGADVRAQFAEMLASRGNPGTVVCANGDLTPDAVGSNGDATFSDYQEEALRMVMQTGFRRGASFELVEVDGLELVTPADRLDVFTYGPQSAHLEHKRATLEMPIEITDCSHLLKAFDALPLAEPRRWTHPKSPRKEKKGRRR